MRTDDRTEEQVQIMQAQRGDLSAFQALLERYAPAAYAIALGMTGNASSAEKALSAAVLSLWKTLPAFPLDESLSARLYAFILHSISELPDSAPQKEPDGKLLFCLRQLSEGHRSILLLREIGNLKWEEIGRGLQLTPGTAESRGRRAMEELRQSFFPNEENPPVQTQEESLTELLHRILPLPKGLIESMLASAAAQPQNLPFTNLPQNRDIHAAQRDRLKTWRKPILIVAALVACLLLILGIGQLAQTLAGG